MLNQYLQKLGFSDKEIAVYLCILENGKLSAAAVSRITKINRTTIYSVAKELIKKRLIHEDLGSTNTYYIAMPIEDLRVLCKVEEDELKQKKAVIEDVIRELGALPKSKLYSVPKIKFIDEDQLEDYLFKQTPRWFESALNNGEMNWWGFEDASWVKMYPDWIKFHWENAPKGLGARFITDNRVFQKTHMEQNFNPERQVKFIDPQKHKFTANHAVLGDYIVFIVTSTKPHYMIEIHDSVMAHNLRETFKLIWDKI